MNELAIIDWGVGGVSVYKLIRDQLGVPVTYFSDTGVTPYGKMTRPELVQRLNKVVRYLGSNGVTHLVIGCNAASTAIPFLIDQGIKIEGMIETAIRSTLTLEPKNLGLIGGRRTVLSGVYRRGFASNGIRVKQRIAQPLSGMIECGDVSSDILKHECRRILAPVKNCSHILLACTHYPAITEVMRAFVSTETNFVDPATDLVKQIAKWKLKADGRDIFLTSGDASAMKKAAQAAFGIEISEVKKVVL